MSLPSLFLLKALQARKLAWFVMYATDIKHCQYRFIFFIVHVVSYWFCLFYGFHWFLFIFLYSFCLSWSIEYFFNCKYLWDSFVYIYTEFHPFDTVNQAILLKSLILIWFFSFDMCAYKKRFISIYAYKRRFIRINAEREEPKESNFF